MSDTYLLDWTITSTGEQPKAAEVDQWLRAMGITPVSLPKVYNSGTVKVEVNDGDALESLWPTFAPMPQTVEDKLSAHIKELLEARALVLRTPESQRSELERLALASTALMLYGYGITDD